MAGDFKKFFIEERENLRRYRTNIEEIIKKYDRDFSDDSVINIKDLSVHQGCKRLEKVHPKLFGHSKLRAYKRKEEKLNKRHCEETYCVTNNSENARSSQHNVSGYICRPSTREDEVRLSHQHSPIDTYTESLDSSGQSWSSQDRSDVLSVTPDRIDTHDGVDSGPNSPCSATGKHDDYYTKCSTTYSMKSDDELNRDSASLEETYHEMMTYIASDTEEPSDAETLVSSSDDSIYDSDDPTGQLHSTDCLHSLQDHNRLCSLSQTETNLLSPQTRASESQESGYTSYDLTDETEKSPTPFPISRCGVQKNYIGPRCQIKPAQVNSFLRQRGENLVVWQSADQVREKYPQLLKSKSGFHRVKSSMTKNNYALNKAVHGNATFNAYDEPDCMEHKSKNVQPYTKMSVERNQQCNKNSRNAEANHQVRRIPRHDEETRIRMKRISDSNVSPGLIQCHAKAKRDHDNQIRSRGSSKYEHTERVSGSNYGFATGKDMLMHGKERDKSLKDPLQVHTNSHPNLKMYMYHSQEKRASVQQIVDERKYKDTSYIGDGDKGCECQGCRDEGLLVRTKYSYPDGFYSVSDPLCSKEYPPQTHDLCKNPNEQFHTDENSADICTYMYDVNKTYESAADLTDIDEFLRRPSLKQNVKASRFDPTNINVSSLASIKGGSSELDSKEMTSIEKVEKWRESFNSDRYTLKARRRLDVGKNSNRPGDLTNGEMDFSQRDNEFIQRPYSELQTRKHVLTWRPITQKACLNNEENCESPNKQTSFYWLTGQDSPSTTLSKLKLCSPSHRSVMSSQEIPNDDLSPEGSFSTKKEQSWCSNSILPSQSQDHRKQRGSLPLCMEKGYSTYKVTSPVCTNVKDPSVKEFCRGDLQSANTSPAPGRVSGHVSVDSSKWSMENGDRSQSIDSIKSSLSPVSSTTAEHIFKKPSIIPSRLFMERKERSKDRDVRSHSAPCSPQSPKSVYQRSPLRRSQSPPRWASPKAPVLSIRSINDMYQSPSRKAQGKVTDSDDKHKDNLYTDRGYGEYSGRVLQRERRSEENRHSVRGSQDYVRREEYLRQSLLQSTPIKPNIKLCLNETFSTIAAAGDDGSSEDEVLELTLD